MAGRRRTLLKAVLGTSLIATLAPFLSWGGYLFRPEAAAGQIRQRIINLKDFPVNSKLTFPFPATGDPTVDSDPFRQYILVHLPSGDLKAFSKVCVHLWCLYDYIPEKREFQCPCHGSIYNADTGVSIRGPAALQPYPTNALPELTIEVDPDGTVYATGLKGRIGYGREYRAEAAWIQQRQSTSPDTPAVAYVALKDPLPPEEFLTTLRRYDVQLVKWYGYFDKSRTEREWLMNEGEKNVTQATAVYGADISAVPAKLQRLLEDQRIITLLPR
ncbi:MAG: Rieske 2Fe-2S domain-containing protein [Candidatus Caldarchaeum sp.]|nr:Rieske 2Fe-2S domain-containing protein [Candidatus Caldarchaeum sp.]MCX8200640.1 Rieske 2Fe-2S domain-containing protein [Candidatus Caldarchaeum sp.]MDW8434583.1 Rieske 2Fe-2S domain-containing protein [Candidatus Caldarchaeum sp.]